jgi:hypothetical protein
MAKIWATCGHEITSEWFQSGTGEICTKDYDREFKPCAVYQIVCPKCLGWYKENRKILETDKERTAWMRSRE